MVARPAQARSRKPAEKRLVGGRHVVPAVALLCPLPRRGPESLPPGGVGQERAEEAGQGRRVAGVPPEGGVAGHLPVLGGVVGEDGPTEPHRLDEGRVRSADLGRVDVGRRVRQERPVSLAVDRSRQEDSRVLRGLFLQAGDEPLGVGGRADEDEARIAGDVAKGPDDGVGVVLGLEARDVEDVAAALEPQPVEDREVLRRAEVGAVGDEDRLLSVALEVVAADLLRVRDDDVGQDAREPLGKGIDGLPRPVPLPPVPLEPVDVQEDARSGAEEARQAAGEGVGPVADEDGVVALDRRVQT